LLVEKIVTKKRIVSEIEALWREEILGTIWMNWVVLSFCRRSRLRFWIRYPLAASRAIFTPEREVFYRLSRLEIVHFHGSINRYIYNLRRV